MDKLHERLARAFAPENVKQQLDQIAKLKRQERELRRDSRDLARELETVALRAEMHDAMPTTVAG